MLLVLVAVSTATILAAAYLSSRDNSAAIGENSMRASTARWAAASVVELTVAALETQSNWRTEHDNGVLFTDYAVGVANVTVVLTDLATGEPPNAATEHVRISATADVGGVQQVAEAYAFIHATPPTYVDVTLKEFVAFAEDTIEVKNNSFIARWPESELGEWGQRSNLGIREATSGAVSIQSSAAIDATVFRGPGSVNVASTSGGSPSVQVRQLPNRVPLPKPPTPPVLNPDDANSGVSGTWDINGSFQVLDTDAEHRVHRLRIRNNGTLIVMGDSPTLVIEDRLDMETNGQIRIMSDATIVVYDNIDIRNAKIELVPGATLVLFAGSDVRIEESLLGRADLDSDTFELLMRSWMDPRDFDIFSIDSWNGETIWLIDKKSMVKATIYAPAADFTLDRQSTLCGRVAAKKILIDRQSALLYDHQVDRRRGYTQLSSLLYDSESSMNDHFRTIQTLDADELQQIANETGATIMPTHRDGQLINPQYEDGLGDLVGNLLNGSGCGSETIVGGVIGIIYDDCDDVSPTPRPLPVEYYVIRVGLDGRTLD